MDLVARHRLTFPVGYDAAEVYGPFGNEQLVTVTTRDISKDNGQQRQGAWPSVRCRDGAYIRTSLP
jgi:hypothetical protein